MYPSHASGRCSAIRRILRASLCLFLMMPNPAHTENALPEMKLQKSLKGAGDGNPLYTQRFGADPGVMEYDGRVYVYMTDDIPEYDSTGSIKENSYSLIQCISCISSEDLVNWTDHGKIPVAGDRGIAKWASNSWAPCAAHKTINGKEKFFLYFCNGGNGIGVLTADSPVGPWQDELGHLLITRNTPNCSNVLWLFDPAVMVDDDGTGYLAFGGGVPKGKQAAPGTGRIVRLGEDMLSLDGKPVALDVPYLFEDSGINKIGDRYVYSYCSNWQTDGNDLGLTNGSIQYMTSESPLGPYEYQGELFSNQGNFFFDLYGNNHHSIVSLDDRWFLFYHCRTVERALGWSGNYRSPHVNEILINADGSLRSVTGTLAGVEQLKPLDPYRVVPASTMSDQAGLEVVSKDGMVLVTGDSGSWWKVSGVDFGDGSKGITVTGTMQAPVYVLADSLSSPVSAIITDEAEAVLSLTGIHDLYFVLSGPTDMVSWQVQ